MLGLRSALAEHFGHDAFRPGQAETIGHLRRGRHTLVVMPTGSGKSLIYQLAALLLPGTTLVISPLIALMKDQVEGLAQRGIPATYINSSLSPAEQAQRLREMERGDWRLVYIAPERLRSVSFRQALQRVRVSLLAVDEAHCISQWGHDFRPDYLRIADARAALAQPLTVALTATAIPEVQDEIVRLLGLPTAARVITGFNRPNIAFEVLKAETRQDKLAALAAALRELREGAAIIYTGKRADAEEVAAHVRGELKRRAAHYHAGLDAETRSRVQDEFIAGKLPIIVATNAFGMGIDRSDVRLVLHYAVPGTLEAYYQEAGRAGRDGAPARALLLYAAQDRGLQEWFIDHDTPSLAELELLRAALARLKDTSSVALSDLVAATRIAEDKVRVGLAQMEAAGLLEHLGDSNGRMALRLRRADARALQAVATATEHWREHRRQQLDKMIAYAEARRCRRRMLLDHFGDKGPADAPSCCDNCARRGKRPLLPIAAASAPPAAVHAPRPGHRATKAEARLIALACIRAIEWSVDVARVVQVLHGSRAQDVIAYRYHENPYYGQLSHLTPGIIGRLLSELVAEGYLEVKGSRALSLYLTLKGAAALGETRPRGSGR